MHNEFAAEIAALKARIAALEAELRWQPVEDGKLAPDCTATGEGTRLWFDDEDGTVIVLPDDLRLCRFTPADWVDWEKVPPSYNWVAAVGSGSIYAFVAEPQISRHDWLGSIYCQVPGELPLGIDWRQSLRRRPGSEEE